MKPSILAIIPARGGSKGLPEKNIYPINGKPLIAYTIDAALKSKYISTTVVSSENDAILKVSSNIGADIIKRPAEFATDEASSESVIIDAIKQMGEKGNKFDIIVLLQPTSPLRNERDIDAALELMISEKASAIISVVNIGTKPFKAYYQNKDGYLKGIHSDKSPNMRRQDLPDAFLANGAIYAISIKEFLNTNNLITAKTLPYIMSPNKSLDIDTIEDIHAIETYLKTTKKGQIK